MTDGKMIAFGITDMVSCILGTLKKEAEERFHINEDGDIIDARMNEVADFQPVQATTIHISVAETAVGYAGAIVPDLDLSDVASVGKAIGLRMAGSNVIPEDIPANAIEFIENIPAQQMGWDAEENRFYLYPALSQTLKP